MPDTAKNTVISLDFLVWKLCLSAKLPHQEIKWNYGIFRKWESAFNKVTGPDYADVKNDEKNHDNDDLLPILQTNTETNNVKKKNRANFDILKIQTIFPFYQKTKLFFL